MISRRGALSLLGSASLLAAWHSRGAAAAAQAPAPRPMAGDLDLATLDIVDSHMHPVRRMLISQSYAGQMAEFGALGAPKGDYPDRDAIVARAEQGGRDLVMNAPRRTGYFNYIARTYGVPATIEGFDSVTKQHIGSDQDFVRYINAIFAREKIATVVLQAAEPAPSPPATLIPADRYVWTTVASELTRINWAKERGLTTLADVRAAIDKTMEVAVERGCRGFKSMAAYYRPLAVSKPTQSEAEAAMKRVLAATPQSTGVQNQPIYADAATNAALTTYEDFLFRHVFAKAGALERPMIIHSAVALHPSLRVDFNDPRPLAAVFSDPDMQRARTDFILIHAGYPSTDVVAAFISQFANVYADVSFYSKYPGALLQIYRSLLALGPSSKIMHGSDANSVPEEIGYCAWNTRAVLAKVLSEYRESFGWTQDDITSMAQNVMHRTARKLFRIPG
ncbi:MAG TPA: amidohydrolase family protein [Steroidobacteraceae bacterium]|nr:amidohydrolase family protein [Steroidobacteraceae bacterium]